MAIRALGLVVESTIYDDANCASSEKTKRKHRTGTGVLNMTMAQFLHRAGATV